MTRIALILSIVILVGGSLGSTAAFAQLGDECSGAVPAVLGVPNAFDTTNATNSNDPYSTALCSFPTDLGLMANDIWFSYTPPNDGFLTISTCGTVTFDSELVLYTGSCGSLTQVACNADSLGCSADPFTAVIVNHPVNAAESLLIRLGGFDFTEDGPGTMNISLSVATPEVCTDGIDNDLDGDIDCDDTDCAADPSCVVMTTVFRRADCNQDMGTDVSDAIFTLSILFGGGATPSCLDACDGNDDGGIDIADAIFLLDYLFGAGSPPPSPGPTDCGPDVTTGDPLDCDVAPGCP